MVATSIDLSTRSGFLLSEQWVGYGCNDLSGKTWQAWEVFNIMTSTQPQPPNKPEAPSNLNHHQHHGIDRSGVWSLFFHVGDPQWKTIELSGWSLGVRPLLGISLGHLGNDISVCGFWCAEPMLIVWLMWVFSLSEFLVVIPSPRQPSWGADERLWDI